MTGAHLLMIAQRMPPDIGGLARSGGRVAATLGRLGVAVDVLAWTRALPPGRVEVAAGVPGPVRVHRMGLFSNWDLSLQHSMNLLEWLHREQPFDAVWGHYLFPAGFLACWFAATTGIPSAVSARGNDIDQAMFPPGDFARLMWTLERAQLVTAPSRDLVRKIGLLLGREPPAEVVPNAVDLDVFRPAPADRALRRSLGIADDERILVFSGELRHKKGLPFLLDALTHVRHARAACLLVVGEVRPREEAQLRQYSVYQPADGARILVTGHIDEPERVADHLRLADLVLLPSLWDGMPNALIEAMACEMLTLASDAGGIPELLEHGRDGLLLPRVQLHHLGEAVLEALALPEEERQAMGRRARARVVEVCAPAAEERALGRVMERLLERGPGPAA